MAESSYSVKIFRFKKNFLLLPAVILLILINGCREKNLQPLKPLPLSVRTCKVKKEITAPEISAFGTVMYFSKADVYPTTEGYIDSLEVSEGDRVEKGQLLAKLKQKKLFIEREKSISDLNSKKSLLRLSEEQLASGRKEAEKKIISIRSAENSVKMKKLEMENFRRIYSNKKQLFSAGGLSYEELESVKMIYLKSKYEYEKYIYDLELIKTGYRDEDIREKGFKVPADENFKNRLLVKINTAVLEAEKEVSEAELASAEAELERVNLIIKETEIRSPISGIIGKKYFDIGEKVKPENQIFTVFKSNKVFVRIETGEETASSIDKGMKAEISSGLKTAKGTVSIISPIINPETRTREIKILITNTGNKLVPGSFAKVKIKTGSETERTVIPEEAVSSDRGEKTGRVFIIRNNIVFRKEIEVLYRTDKNAVLKTEGLKEGEILCLDPPKSLSDGREVRIIQ